VSRLDTLADPSGRSLTVHYDATGQLSEMDLPNGIVDAFHFDPSGVLTGREATLGSSTVARSDYSLDPATARRSSSTDLAGTTNYSYQDNGWLTSATPADSSGSGSESFSYDGAGNRTAWTDTPVTTVSYNAAGQLKTAGTVTFSYDNEGNMTSKLDTATGAQTNYHWNADHQLTSVDLPDGSTSRYRYDPLGRRVESVDGTRVTRYAYDAFNLVATYDGSNALLASYVTLPTGADTASGEPADAVELRRGITTQYYLHDGSASTTALTDETGAVTARYGYSAFGVPATGNGTDNAYTYTGAPYDAATGLYYLNDRYYDPALGRFLTQDPPAQQQYAPPTGRWTHRLPGTDVTQPMTLSAYGYATNDPIDFSDPSGDGWKGQLAAPLCALALIFADTMASHLPANPTAQESPVDPAELALHCADATKEALEDAALIQVAWYQAQLDARIIATELLRRILLIIVRIIQISVQLLRFDD
jgi:RHS repeat-associated protein